MNYSSNGFILSFNDQKSYHIKNYKFNIKWTLRVNLALQLFIAINSN